MRKLTDFQCRVLGTLYQYDMGEWIDWYRHPTHIVACLAAVKEPRPAVSLPVRSVGRALSAMRKAGLVGHDWDSSDEPWWWVITDAGVAVLSQMGGDR